MRAEATSQYFRFREPTDPAEAGEALLRIFRSDPSADVHREAAAALARAPSTPRNEALALEMSAIVSRSTEFWERFAAFRVLLATCTERARKTILACLADPDESFRRSAIHGVGQYQLTEAVPLLGRWLNGPEALDDTSRLYCMNSLSVIPTAESARLLLRCAVENADESLKYAAVERLLANDALRGDELAAELIALYKKSRDLAGTDYLIDLLGKNGSIQAYKLLSADYHAATPERRDYIASVLLGYDHAPEFAAANLMDLVRTINGPGALRAAAQGDPRLAVPGLAKVCAMKDLPTETRSEAIQSLGRLGSPNAVEVLQQILKTETDEDLLRDIQRHLDRLSDDP